MYTKLFLSLAFLAVASASLYGEKYITVNHDGTHCKIVSENGMQIDLIKNQFVAAHGLKTFDITLHGRDFFKTFHIDNQVCGDILFDLCARHEGVIDDALFQHLLYKIYTFVQQGEVHPRIFHMFKCLENHEMIHMLDNEAYLGRDFLYGRNYYNKMFFPSTMYHGKYGMDSMYYTPSIWNQMLYKRQMPYYGTYTPSVWNQAMYRHQMPHYYQWLNQGMNKWNMNNLLESQIEPQVEREVEREVEQEFENQMENRMVNKYYGQEMPFYHRGLYFNNVVPKSYYGMNHYGYNTYFNNYMRPLMHENTLYDQSPMNHYYNMWMGTHMRMPMTVY